MLRVLQSDCFIYSGEGSALFLDAKKEVNMSFFNFAWTIFYSVQNYWIGVITHLTAAPIKEVFLQLLSTCLK